MEIDKEILKRGLGRLLRKERDSLTTWTGLRNYHMHEVKNALEANASTQSAYIHLEEAQKMVD
jgi:hypothetical protein